MTCKLAGVFPVLPMVFTDDGAIDPSGLARVVEFVIDSGAAGVVFPGLASEYDMLTLDEREQLIQVVGEAANGRVAFVVGASSDRLEDSARLACAGANVGAAAAMVMTPRQIGHDMAAQRDFYASLGNTARLPLMLQNAPAPMGLGFSTDQLLQIMGSVDVVRWIKEENMPCGQRISGMLSNAPPHLSGVFGGAGGRYIIDELARGAIGSMPAAETPRIHVALLEAHRAGEEERARDLYEAMLPILMMQAVFRWRLTKEVLRRSGVIGSAFTRAPGPELDAGDQDQLTQILARLERNNWVGGQPAI